MSKKTIILVVIVFLVSFGVTCFLLKKDKVPTFKIANHITMNHGVIGAINYQGIENIVVAEMFRDPLALMGLKSNFEESQFAGSIISTLIKGGIDKGQKIILFKPKYSNDGSYVLIALENAKKITKNLNKQLTAYKGVKLNIEQTAFANYYPEDSIGVVVNDSMILLTYTDKNTTINLWKQISTSTNCYRTDSKGINAIVNNEHHISIWTDNNSLVSSINERYDEVVAHIDFKDGHLAITANIRTDSTYFSNQQTNTYNSDSNALVFHLNMENLNSFPNLLSTTANSKVDSVSQLFNIKYPDVFSLSNGRFDLNIVGEGIREDVTITYEFDDDFNKVKKEKIITTPIVNFVLSLGNENEALYQQFKNQKIIKLQNNDELFTNPVGKCYIQSNSQELVLASNKQLFADCQKSDTTSCGLYLEADFEKLMKLFPEKNKNQFSSFKNIVCTGVQQDSLVSFDLSITTMNLEKNVLFDIIEELQKSKSK